MIKLIAFISIFAMRIIYQPTDAQSSLPPFANATISTTTAGFQLPAKLLSFQGSIKEQKVILDWRVADNESAKQFEVEKSTDGKKFSLAALVFGTDQPETGNYSFSEKGIHQKTLYRIRVIDKDEQITNSAVIELNPAF